jgi:hypothetical protein
MLRTARKHFLSAGQLIKNQSAHNFAKYPLIRDKRSEHSFDYKTHKSGRFEAAESGRINYGRPFS